MTRVLGHCPVCEADGRDALVEITPTGERHHPERTSTRWRLVLHPDGKGGICEGSGRTI